MALREACRTSFSGTRSITGTQELNWGNVHLVRIRHPAAYVASRCGEPCGKGTLHQVQCMPVCNLRRRSPVHTKPAGGSLSMQSWTSRQDFSSSPLQVNAQPRDEALSRASKSARSGGKGKRSKSSASVPSVRVENGNPVTGVRAAKGVAEPPVHKGRTGSKGRYLFHINGGGQVQALVDLEEDKYLITITADVAELGVEKGTALLLHWGLSGSDREQWTLVDPKAAPSGTYVLDGELEAMRTPLKSTGRGKYNVDLSIHASKAPVGLTFVLYQPKGQTQEERWFRSSSSTNFCVPVGLQRGRPEPLGATVQKDGSINFAFFSRNAEGVVLCLYKPDDTEPSMEVSLNPASHRTGDVWHLQFDCRGYNRYGYRCKGEMTWEKGNRFHSRSVLLDPYARVLAPFLPGQEKLPSPALALGLLPEAKTKPFNWEEDFPPGIPLQEVVAYRMNVGGFSADQSSGAEPAKRGTFAGVATNADHLVALGVNTVILQPVAAFDETLGSYFPVSLFAPAPAYGPGNSGSAACTAFKEMVKGLHQKGIEVIIDVVFSHTAEGDDFDPKFISFRGIDNSTYYLCDEFGKLRQPEFGVGNALNCNHPTVIRMLVDCLRWWVEEYHVDGFCFINAQALVTGPHGQQLSRPPLVEEISFDPLLSQAKLIADTQSPVNGLIKDLAFPHWGRWAEWNVRFRNDMRRFMRGEANLSGLATRLCGSADVFTDIRGPQLSYNNVTSAYGFSLADLVTYSDPGQDQRVVNELSWNCGEEGPSSNEMVMLCRTRQVRNFLLLLMLSQGTPVLTMGDEYGHSKEGKTDLEDRQSRFRWDFMGDEYAQKVAGYIALLTEFRQMRPVLFQRTDFNVARDLEWHGRWPNCPEWDNLSSCVLAVTLHGPQEEPTTPKVPDPLAPEAFLETPPPLPPKCAEGDLYVAFNSHNYNVTFSLPQPPEGTGWYRLVDTNLGFEDDFAEERVLVAGSGMGESPHGAYDLGAYSILLLEAQRVPVVKDQLSSIGTPFGG